MLVVARERDDLSHQSERSQGAGLCRPPSESMSSFPFRDPRSAEEEWNVRVLGYKVCRVGRHGVSARNRHGAWGWARLFFDSVR